jgi:hypothetical protein
MEERKLKNKNKRIHLVMISFMIGPYKIRKNNKIKIK